MRTKLLFLLLILGAGRLSAQTRTVAGVVTAGDQPVPNQPVSLHRVTGEGGNTLASDTTDASGRFSLVYTPAAGEAVHFVATRYQDQLYIGESFRDEPLEASYVVAVGPGASPINLGTAVRETAAPTPVDPQSRTTGIVIAAVILLVSAGLVFAATRFRSSPTRRLLVEIGELDNRHLQHPVENYEALRSDLLRRLRETA